MQLAIPEDQLSVEHIKLTAQLLRHARTLVFECARLWVIRTIAIVGETSAVNPLGADLRAYVIKLICVIALVHTNMVITTVSSRNGQLLSHHTQKRQRGSEEFHVRGKRHKLSSTLRDIATCAVRC